MDNDNFQAYFNNKVSNTIEAQLRFNDAVVKNINLNERMIVLLAVESIILGATVYSLKRRVNRLEKAERDRNKQKGE